MHPEQHPDTPHDTQPADGERASVHPSDPAMEARLDTEVAEGHALADRAEAPEAGRHDWLAAEEVAVMPVPGQEMPTPQEVAEHAARARDTVDAGERAHWLRGRTGRWVMLGGGATVVGIIAIAADKRRKRVTAHP